MKLLRKLHRWFCLLISIVIIFTAISGVILTFKDEIMALSISGNVPIYSPPDIQQTSEALKNLAIADTKKIRFPTENFNYFTRITDDFSYFYHPDNLLQMKAAYNIPVILNGVVELHTSLFAGHTGETIVGFFGLGLVFVILNGVLIWIPTRRSFRINKTVPKNMKRGSLLHSHRNLGVLVGGMFVLIAVTGVGMVFYDNVRGVFYEVYSAKDNVKKVDEIYIKVENRFFQPWDKILHRVNDALPHGRITSYSVAKDPNNAMWKFRLRYKEDWLPNGSSFVKIDPYTAEAVSIIDARKAHPVDRLMRKFFPLHSGKIGGRLYQLLITLSGICLLLMIFTGFSSWIKTKRKKRG